MHKIVRCLLVLLCLLVCCTAIADGEFPTLNDAGFLSEGEFIYADPEGGVWRYANASLRIEILRYHETNPAETWYEAEIWAADGELFHLIPNDAEKWMKSTEYPYKIARKTGTVFAVNTDYAQLRFREGKKPGVIIRSGRVFSEKTVKADANGFPNLDTMAFLPDGSMQVHKSNELTAQEYLDMGAYDVLAFGPYLIREGELNTAALKKYGSEKAPRTAVGMIEPGHYVAMMLEGRHSGSKGGPVSFLAEKLYDRGCTEAINLDGGQTCTMVFMGKQICTVVNTAGNNASGRKAAEILGIGHSDQLPDLSEKMGY